LAKEWRLTPKVVSTQPCVTLYSSQEIMGNLYCSILFHGCRLYPLTRTIKKTIKIVQEKSLTYIIRVASLTNYPKLASRKEYI
jgi:hypothetical protein